MDIREKSAKLKQYLLELESVAVCFSGGVDSTFLLKTAHDVLGENAVAVTARSLSFPARELEEAAAFCKRESIRHAVLDFDELAVEGFSKNPENRCYLCKSALLSDICAFAESLGLRHVTEGSNVSDGDDYRPGFAAVCEHNVKSPLRYAGLTKDEIRVLSRESGLSTWDKPSLACLVTRFPYDTELTREKLNMAGRAEQFLLDLGLRQVRVRVHDNLARVETDEEGFKLLSGSTRDKAYAGLKDCGFTYIALDLRGYRTGSMNETLPNESVE